MFSSIIWLAGIVLELLLLVRSLQTRLIGKYPFFYTYSGAVLLMAILLLFPDLYHRWYWSTQFFTLILGYGILLEILNHALAPYPGAERFARMTGLVAFGLITSFVVIFPIIRSRWSVASTMQDLERDFRTVQAVFIFGLAAVISYYRIALGKNMKGMIGGYGLYISTSLMSLALGSYSANLFRGASRVFRPFTFDISLIIWVVALWSYSPDPTPESGICLEQDYEAFVAKTRTAMRSYLRTATRRR
jgi:hypothetical protein